MSCTNILPSDRHLELQTFPTLRTRGGASIDPLRDDRLTTGDWQDYLRHHLVLGSSRAESLRLFVTRSLYTQMVAQASVAPVLALLCSACNCSASRLGLGAHSGVGSGSSCTPWSGREPRSECFWPVLLQRSTSRPTRRIARRSCAAAPLGGRSLVQGATASPSALGSHSCMHPGSTALRASQSSVGGDSAATCDTAGFVVASAISL